MTEQRFKYWLLAFTLSSVAYLFIRHLNWMPCIDWAPKIIPILLLLWYVVVSIQGRVRNLLLTGLGFSLLGDILLSLNGLFIQGLGAFLIAQLTYAGLFFSQARISKAGISFGIIMIALVTITAWQILPHTGDLKWVVLAYMVAITTMAISAGLRDDPFFLFTALGAGIFVLSDTLIAVNKFIAPFEWAGVGIMITYYLAQLMITLGVCRHWILQHRSQS